jgi:hypothetical protein
MNRALPSSGKSVAGPAMLRQLLFGGGISLINIGIQSARTLAD